MKKFFFFFFLFFFSFAIAQKEVDSLAIVSKENSKYYKQEKPIAKKFDSNFQEKYQSKTFKYAEENKNKALTAWELFKKKISDFFASLFSFSNNGKVFSGIEIAFKILAYGIILFVIFMIVKLIINKEGGWVFARNKKKIFTAENIEDNIHFINFKEVIAQAKSNNNFRMATRYYYLWLLKSLTDRNIIDWDIEKTNSDYLYEISNESLKKEFEFLSYIYDYCWYGEFELSNEDFTKAENHFINAIKNL